MGTHKQRSEVQSEVKSGRVVQRACISNKGFKALNLYVIRGFVELFHLPTFNHTPNFNKAFKITQFS